MSTIKKEYQAKKNTYIDFQYNRVYDTTGGNSMDHHFKTKLPEKLYDHFCKQIRSGELKPGTKLPTVLQLAEQFQISAFSAAAAVRQLKRDGWIEAAPGRGSSVAAKIPEQQSVTPQKTVRDTIYFFFEKEKVSYRNWVEAISEEAASYKYRQVSSLVENEKEMKRILKYAEQDAAGFICTHSFIHRHMLLHRNVPTVILNSGHHHFGYNEIIPDNYDTGWAVADYLRSHGHTRLSFITSFPPKYILGGFHFRERLSGFSDYCSYYRLPPPEVYYWDVRKKNGCAILRQIMQKLLKRSEHMPTAAAVGNNFMLEEIMEYAKKEFNIPDFSRYMSLITFQDNFGEKRGPAADTATIPLRVFAKESIRLLLHLMNPETAKYRYRNLISMEIIPGYTVHRLK